MALLNKYTDTNTGLVIEKAYYKARKDVDIKGNIVTFSCDVYASQQSRIDGKSPLASIEYNIETKEDISTDETIRAAQLYSLLKTLPEFENAIDC